MSHVVVTNSFAKTFKIPTTPTKYLTEVRDEACQKFGVSKDQFTLKYNNKPISLSQQIRLANLPQGARLELVQASRSPTVVSVALQLPKSRLTQKFANNTSLWEILRYFESGDGANYNFTQRAVPEMSGASGSGRLCYEMPVITVMPSHKEQSSFVGLQQTLSQLGFDSGSALLKLSFKNSGTPLEEAMAQITQYFKVGEPAASTAPGAHAAEPAQQKSAPDPDTAAPEATTTVAGQTIKSDEPEPELMDVDTPLTTESVAEPVVSEQNNASVDDINTSPAAALAAATSTATSEPPQAPIEAEASPQPRNVQVFSASSSSTPQAARNTFNESDYQPTVEHAKIHQAQLSNRTRNQRLLSDKELEAQESERQAKLTAATNKPHSLRIRLPDGSLVQMNLTKQDTASDLYAFVTTLLEHKKEPFDLKYTGPTGRLVPIPPSPKRLIQDLRFSTNELITFQWGEAASAAVRSSRSALASEWQAKAQTLKVEEPVVKEPAVETKGQTVAQGKRKVLSGEEKESKLKNILGKGLFKRK
ncbi:GLUT4 regulating protein TUG-domain-containing protein [Boeremia exigua]|uniref:GLUT4 regulating protein TUG-domain-containing protein n=1 Tax=Boeremia exigua TaxID=749465 RepID=UPI001E8DEC91|nr:GLUT4 regulating protein TUG-domain-containing protein [Boeremia exigua]KAH6629826.1 GLUT4 regulating protein TUG-domain-containing protein [Boeremia exigua]